MAKSMRLTTILACHSGYIHELTSACAIFSRQVLMAQYFKGTQIGLPLCNLLAVNNLRGVICFLLNLDQGLTSQA